MNREELSEILYSNIEIKIISPLCEIYLYGEKIHEIELSETFQSKIKFRIIRTMLKILEEGHTYRFPVEDEIYDKIISILREKKIENILT